MIFTPPDNITTRDRNKPSIFLAGTIDMGSSVDWQRITSEVFKDKGFNVFNPRRKDWDSSLEQSYKDAVFAQQVRWELDALTQADYIIVQFLRDSASPITFLELGAFSKKDKLYVVCPHGFYRKGNVDIFCQYYNIPLFTDMDIACRAILKREFPNG